MHLIQEMNNPVINRFVAAVMVGLFTVQPGAAQFLEIIAEIETYGYRLDDPDSSARAKPKTFSVRCVTGKGQWRIENDSVPGSERISVFDGTNIYQSLGFVPPRSAEIQSGIAKTNGNSPRISGKESRSDLTISVWESHDGLPLGDAAVNIPWLAFCSGDYLKRKGRLVPLMADTLRHTRDRFGYRDVTITFGDELGLPKTVDLFTSKALLEASENDFDREADFGDRYAAWKKKMVAELQEGLLMFHYAVLESTNVSGRNFPARFEFFQNGRPYEQNGNWFARGNGRVISIRQVAELESVFDPGARQTIIDCRFWGRLTSRNAIIYTTTNAFVAPTNSAELQERLRQQLERIPKTSQ